MKSKNLATFISAIVGLAIGLMCPIIFTLLDLSELGMEITAFNILDVLNSQRIYSFSIIAFPLAFSTLFAALTQAIIAREYSRRSRDFVTNVINSLEDFIFTVDYKNKLEAQNKKGHVDIYSIVELLNSKTEFEDLVQGKISSFEIEIRNKHYLIHYAPALIQQAGTKGILSLKDVTDIHDKQEIINKKNKELEMTSRLSAIGEIAAGVAHEINNPLAIIQGNVLLLLRKVKSGKEITTEVIDKAEDKIVSGFMRVAEIIKDLKKLTNSHESSEINTIDELMKTSLTIVQSITNNHGIEFKLDVEPSKDTNVHFNNIDFSQILINLIKNSADAINELKGKKWIKIKVKSDVENVYFEVSDSGAGIPAELLDKIFTPLVTTREIGQRTGLGLSLSTVLAKKNKAILTYDESAKNTTFVIKAQKVIEAEKSDKKAA